MRGVRFRVARGMGVSYAFGREHRIPLSFLEEQVRLGQVCYDVGANQGQFTLPLAKMVGPYGRVFAFEPAPANYAALCENVRLNELRNITPLALAVGEESGRRKFVFDANRNTMGTFSDVSFKLNATSPSIEVDCIQLDELYSRGWPEPDLIKIDVEGAAALVLAGATRLLREKQPHLLIELHQSGSHHEERDAIQMLVSHGLYHVTMLDGKPLDIPTGDGERHAWCWPEWSH